MIIRDGLNPYSFTHNPRTSGTSIQSFLKTYCDGQYYIKGNENPSSLVYHRVFAHGPERIKDYYNFGFVRNPFSRELSLYNLFFPTKSISFKHWVISRFVEKDSSRSEKYVNLYTLPQYGYFCNRDGKITINVFRYEEREEALKEIGENIKINMTPAYRPAQNSARFDIRNYQQEYDNEMVDILGKAHEIDLKYFGYSFDGFATPNKDVTFEFTGNIRYYITNYLDSEQHNKYKYL